MPLRPGPLPYLTMRQYQTVVTVPTKGKRLHEITGEVRQVVVGSGVGVGLCTVFVRHTSASLTIQENADPSVQRDLADFMTRLVPEQGGYLHSSEGPDDMPAHIRSALTSTSEQIPVTDGRLALGTWQGLYLWEHRQRPHRRQVIIHIVGE